MSTRTPSGDVPVRPIDRILSYTALGLIALAIVCFFAIIIGTGAHADQTAPFWVTVFWVTAIAPAVGFLLIFTVIVMSFVRRSRANKAG